MQKKSKTNREEKKSLDEMLNPLKNYLEEPESPMNYESFKSFIQKIKKFRQAKEVALEFNNDVKIISELLFNLYPKLESRSMKSRFIKIRNSLDKKDYENLESNEEDYSSPESDMSSSYNMDNSYSLEQQILELKKSQNDLIINNMVSFDKVHEFISDSYKTTCSQIAKKVSEYTDNLPAFLLVLKEIHKITTCTAIKSMITRLLSNIQENFKENKIDSVNN